MSAVRVVYHLARADFFERVRRYSFLITLGMAAFLGYQVAIGKLTLQLDTYRGEFNSAWVGSMLSVIATFFFGWFGFYLVKGSVARDRETGVGQIIATTPLTRPLYTLGKWASNFAVLMAMVVVLAVAGIGIQLLTGENMQIDLVAMFAPYIFIAMPMMALVAALAVLFETIGFLSGGFGNIVYFFFFIFSIIPFLESSGHPAFEPTGIVLLEQSMGLAAKEHFPAYQGGFVLGGTTESITGVFQWAGVDWTPGIILIRFGLFGIAIVMTLLAAIFFDRFDPSRHKPAKIRSKKNTSDKARASSPLPKLESVSSNLTPLTAASMQFSFITVLLSELRLLLKGQRWWWYAVAGGLFVAGLVNSVEISRTYLLIFAWLWPVLIWSGMGNREMRHNVQQLTFSSAAPLWRQLPASWLAGYLVAILTGSGVALRLLFAGDSTGLLAWAAGAVFIPSMALALGVWSQGNKLFEVLYVTMWYIGPLNKVPALDYMGASGEGFPLAYLGTTLGLVALAFLGRARQLQN